MTFGRNKDNVQFCCQLEELNLNLFDHQYEQFDCFFHLLVEWNKKMNLTGITEYHEVITKHFVDSLSIVKSVDLSKIDTVIDIGTGAGFPGIPLKIAFPHLQITLLDSLKKRISFLDYVIEQLNLTQIQTLHGRAEDYARHKNYREKFDLSVSRAVANLSVLGEYCLPFVKVGGGYVAYKSDHIDQELSECKNAVKELGGSIDDVSKFLLPGSNIGRTLVRICKIKQTSPKYPRRAGIPIKNPL
jgi:16S rRNA (guanine527-N7)-methyltransferase